MRNTMLLSLFITLALSSLAQDSLSNKILSKAGYLKRSKAQKTGAWVLTAWGTAGLLITLVADATQTVGGGFLYLISAGTYEQEHKPYTGAYLLSGACVVGGIYLFTASSKNKRKAKAMSITMGMEKTEVLKYNSVYKRSFPTVGLRIRI